MYTYVHCYTVYIHNVSPPCNDGHQTSLCTRTFTATLSTFTTCRRRAMTDTRRHYVHARSLHCYTVYIHNVSPPCNDGHQTSLCTYVHCYTVYIHNVSQPCNDGHQKSLCTRTFTATLSTFTTCHRRAMTDTRRHYVRTFTATLLHSQRVTAVQ